MKIFMIAGEESGDILGADVMAALKTTAPQEEFIFRGIGGTRMDAHELASLFPMQELSLMGITEILPKVPHLLKRISQTADAIEVFQPDILLTIDSPDFCFRVAKEVQKRRVNVPLKVHYVAPTVWAWRPKRAQKVAALYDAILCLFPFEPPYFEKEGMRALFTGHPMSTLLEDVSSIDFLAAHDLSEKETKIGILCGSRHSEIGRMGPVFVDAIKHLIAEGTTPTLILPTLPHLQKEIETLFDGLDVLKLIITDKTEKYQAMAACNVAMATSGTVGLELSVLGVPHVIGYKMNSLTYEIGKRLVTTPYAHLSNIILQKAVVPEFIQQDCTAENIASAVQHLLTDKTAQTEQKKNFKEVATHIKGADDLSPSMQIAEFLLKT